MWYILRYQCEPQALLCSTWMSLANCSGSAPHKTAVLYRYFGGDKKNTAELLKIVMKRKLTIRGGEV